MFLGVRAIRERGSTAEGLRTGHPEGPKRRHTIYRQGLVVGAHQPARQWLGRSPRRLERMSAGGGITMIGLGVALAVTGRRN